MLTYYIATALANWQMHNEVRDALETYCNVGQFATGTMSQKFFEITYDWTLTKPIGANVPEREGLPIRLPCPLSMPMIAMKEINGVLEADFVVVIIPQGDAYRDWKGRGAHCELGAALGLAKPVLLFRPYEADDCSSSGRCVFYDHPLVNEYSYDEAEDIARSVFSYFAINQHFKGEQQ
jgi:hypothetical protein